MTYLVCPIVEIDEEGNQTLSEGAKYLEAYYIHMEYENLLPYAFYDGSAKTQDEFYKTILDKSTIFAFMFDKPNGFPIGHIFFNSMLGYCATGHFCISRDYHKNAVTIGRDCLKAIYEIEREDGTPFLIDIIGVTPVSNKAAIRYVKKLGFEPVCKLSKSCYMYYKGKYEDGIMTRRTRDGLS